MLSSSGMTGRGNRVHWKRFSIGEINPGRPTSPMLGGAEEFVKPAAEMPARLDRDGAGTGNVGSHHLKEDRVGALHAVRHDDNGDAAHLQRRAQPERQARAGIDVAVFRACAP